MSIKVPFKLVIDEKACTLCLRCVQVCPNLAMLVQNNRIRVLEERCSACMACAKVCPVAAIKFLLEDGTSIAVRDAGVEYEWTIKLLKSKVRIKTPKQKAALGQFDRQ